MKTKQFALGLAAVAALALTLTGCGTAGNLLTQPGTIETLRPAQTNYVTITATNLVTVTNTVDGVETVTATPVVSATVQPVILPAITFTNQAVSAMATTALNSAGVGGTMLGVPFSPLIVQALLAAAALAVTWLNQRNRRKLLAEQAGHAETADALALAEDVGKTLVLNLEQLRKTALQVPGYTPDIDNRVMTIIQQVQEAAGVKSVVNDLVDEHTGYTLGGEAGAK